MKKEVILAIVIGFGIGLLITFGIYTARTALDQKQTDDQIAASLPPVSDDQTTSSTLIINTPANESLLDSDTVPLEGKSAPNSVVTIISSLENQIIPTQADGIFKTEIELEGGLNQIVISAFNESGEKTSTQLSLVFSTADIE